MSKIDVTIKETAYQPKKDLQSSKLIIDLQGKDINNAVVNGLRLVSYLNVPTYGFCDQTINITFNDSVFNSDEMRSRLTQITPPNVNVKSVHLPDKYWKNVDFSDPNHEKSPDEDKKIQLVLTAHNDTTSNMNVTTSHAKYIEDGEEIPTKFSQKYPSLLIQLRPNESFRFIANAVLCTGERGHNWSSVASSWFVEKSPNHYVLTLKSQGQMNEYEALVKVCRIIVKKIADIQNKIEENYKDKVDANTRKLTIVLDNEDHAMGNLISRTLQDLPEIVFASYSKPDHLVKSIVLKIISSKNPLDSLFVGLKHINYLFLALEKELFKIGKNHLGSFK